MLTICSSHITNDCATRNFDEQNSIIFYNFVGNFVPPEWRNLSSNTGKVLSKTSRQLLSLIVFRLQIYHNNSLDELQETYNFFEQSLGVCQERVRQCLLELQKVALFKFTTQQLLNMALNAVILLVLSWLEISNLLLIKYHLKMKKFFLQLQKTLGSTPKNFWLNPKKV